MPPKKWTPASDRAADKKAGVKPGSARDNALDKSRGVPIVVVAVKPKKKR
jgi:hypothetical protein